MGMINLMFIHKIILWNPSLATYLTPMRYSWSLLIIILNRLEHLWSHNLSGHFDKVAERYLI